MADALHRASAFLRSGLCRESLKVADDLPPLLLRQAAPRGHAAFQAAVSQQPLQLAWAGMLDRLRTEIRTLTFAFRGASMARRAILLEEFLPRLHSLWIGRKRICTCAIGFRNPL